MNGLAFALKEPIALTVFGLPLARIIFEGVHPKTLFYFYLSILRVHPIMSSQQTLLQNFSV